MELRSIMGLPGKGEPKEVVGRGYHIVKLDRRTYQIDCAGEVSACLCMIGSVTLLSQQSAYQYSYIVVASTGSDIHDVGQAVIDGLRLC